MKGLFNSQRGHDPQVEHSDIEENQNNLRFPSRQSTIVMSPQAWSPAGGSSLVPGADAWLVEIGH